MHIVNEAQKIQSLHRCSFLINSYILNTQQLHTRTTINKGKIIILTIVVVHTFNTVSSLEASDCRALLCSTRQAQAFHLISLVSGLLDYVLDYRGYVRINLPDKVQAHVSPSLKCLAHEIYLLQQRKLREISTSNFCFCICGTTSIVTWLANYTLSVA
ncbi:Hypothetical_protein [Hexamita inflata]|uniref:Hypothetical_protein n=1 Tax=Hexamita inflata TaxID=28002 RepID=A0AA86U272_9EUKA|nr:Hypothetical protein HINF_LOCUS24856 [Hexamita inflata]